MANKENVFILRLNDSWRQSMNSRLLFMVIECEDFTCLKDISDHINRHEMLHGNWLFTAPVGKERGNYRVTDREEIIIASDMIASVQLPKVRRYLEIGEAL